MRFVSTAGNSSASVSLAEALRRGLAADGGLYVPESLPPLPSAFFESLPELDLVEIASTVIEHLLAGDLEPEELRRIAADAFDFPIPLVTLSDRVRFLELFHGPTLAFKDVGARCLARLLAATRQDDKMLTVLAATSGDTGGAVAHAFFGLPETRVVVLYPQGQVSPLQERQFATLGENVRTFAVDGTFDDCQALVKRAFADRELVSLLRLTSANSINVGRLLPQIVYYFQATAQLSKQTAQLSKQTVRQWSQTRSRQQGGGDRPILFSTPSGNFGSLAAGLMARALGLEARFVAATNKNDVVPCYLETGTFQPRPSLRTVSNAMDVGNPSNFARIEHLYGGDVNRLRRHLRGRAYSDEATLRAIRDVAHEQGYVMDPHTAVGYLALVDSLTEEPSETVGIVLSTAHPAKFLDVVEPEIGRPLKLPPELAERLEEPILSEPIPHDYDILRARMLVPD